MSHEINSIDFQQGREMAWHGLTDVKPELSLKDSRFAQWDYLELPTFLEYNGQRMATGEKRLVCSDIGLPVGKTYSDSRTQFTNGELIELMESALSDAGAKLESCGTVRNRETRFFSFSVEGAEKFQAGGQLHKMAISIVDDIVGRFKMFFSLNMTKAVCANTVATVLRTADSESAVKHTLNARKRLPSFHEAIEKAIHTQDEYIAKIDRLANERVNTEEAKGIFAAFMAQDMKAKTLSRRAINTTDELVSLFLRGAGNKGETLNDVFSAVTDYYSHNSSGGDDKQKQFESSEFGAAAKAKNSFLELLEKPVGELRSLAKVGNDLIATSLVALDAAKTARANALTV